MTVAALNSLLERSALTSYPILHAELGALDSLSKGDVVALARGLGIKRRLPTKAKALEAVKGLILGRKDAAERTSF